MTDDKLERWEKWPIWLLMGANGVMIFHWFTAAFLPAWLAWLLGMLYTVGGFSAAVAIDGAMVACTMGRREGRDGFWSHASAAVATAFGAAVALDLHGAIQIGAWIHAGFALLIFCYLQHLAQRRAARAQDGAPAAHNARSDTHYHLHLEQDVRTVADFVRWRVGELRAADPRLTDTSAAAALGTNRDMIRRALAAQDTAAPAAQPGGDLSSVF